MSLYFFLYPLSSAFFQNDYMTSFFKSWLKLCCSRGSCGGKGEGKGSGRTSGQGHSSEVETHDQEFAVRSRERKQKLCKGTGIGNPLKCYTYTPKSLANATRNLSQQNFNF
ncbi:hypothetical protein AHAS_Ahas05G0063200 [Arachis hypogaea]